MLKEKKMGEKANLLLLVQDARNLVKEQEVLTSTSPL